MKDKYFYEDNIPLSEIIFLKEGQKWNVYEGESVNRPQRK
jgi:hypothetical protein